MVRIRDGRPGDAPALAALHVEVWRAAYGGLAPAEAVAALDEARRLPVWQGLLAAAGPATGVIVAEDVAGPVGVVGFAPSVHPAFGGAVEIKHFYVASAAQGQGVGRRLFEATRARLAGGEVALAVVEENVAARAFYRALGGQECGRFTDPGPLWRSSNIVVRWGAEVR